VPIAAAGDRQVPLILGDAEIVTLRIGHQR
jgi:hypothetical protein